MKKKLFSFALTFVLCLGLTVPTKASNLVSIGTKTTVSSVGTTTGVIDKNGSLWMWGHGGDGILGIGEVEPDYVQSTPRKIMDNVVSVGVGNASAAIKTDGSLLMWGDNGWGEMGNGSNVETQYTPIKIMDNVVAVSCGAVSTAVIKTDGSLWMWGGNEYGELGNNPELGPWRNVVESVVNRPVKVMDNVAAVSCGRYYTAAVKTDGSLWMWGRNGSCQLGNGGSGNGTRGSETIQTVPIKVMDGVVSVSCGDNAAAAIKTDGSLWMWGAQNSDFYHSRKPTVVTKTPVKVIDGGVKAVSAGDTTAIIKEDNSLWIRGDNLFGQLGDGSTEDADNFVKIMDDVVYASTGRYTACAVKSDGSFWMWGLNSDNRLGVSGGNEIRDRAIIGGTTRETLQTVPLKITDIVVKVPASMGNTNQPVAPSTVGGFTDVKADDYYADAVQWAVAKKITSGTSATTFSPNSTCSKAQILTFLWRANGSPEPTTANPFTDIKTTDYFYKAALWAAEKGLVSGSTFGANTACTRAMTVEYMWKAAGSPASAGKASFTDVPANADYAQAVAWAVEKGVTAGTSKTTFSPSSTCTRGQIVTFLHRAMGK